MIHDEWIHCCFMMMLMLLMLLMVDDDVANGIEFETCGRTIARTTNELSVDRTVNWQMQLPQPAQRNWMLLRQHIKVKSRPFYWNRSGKMQGFFSKRTVAKWFSMRVWSTC